MGNCAGTKKSANKKDEPSALPGNIERREGKEGKEGKEERQTPASEIKSEGDGPKLEKPIQEQEAHLKVKQPSEDDLPSVGFDENEDKDSSVDVENIDEEDNDEKHKVDAGLTHGGGSHRA